MNEEKTPWLEQLSDLRRVIQAKERATQKPKISRAKEIVAGGEILWKPVNREAAKLLWKSSEIYHPPPNMGRGDEIHHFSEKVDKNLDKASDWEMSCSIADSILKRSSKMMNKDIVEYSDEVRQARKVLEDATDNFRATVLEFTDELPGTVKKLRSWRMTMEAERTLSIKALTELREFFLGHDYDKEMVRLSEFVRLCEKLKTLAEDGTLDKVADTMLKLAQ